MLLPTDIPKQWTLCKLHMCGFFCCASSSAAATPSGSDTKQKTSQNIWPCSLVWHHGIMIWLLRRQMRMRMQVQMQTRMQIHMQMRVQVRMQMEVRMKVQVQIRGSRMHVRKK